jgi:hypothetical protein
VTAAWLLLALPLAGCPSGSDRADGSAPAGALQKCTRVGQTCEFSPNKLGSCVMRDNCSEDCLVCQSQH